MNTHYYSGLNESGFQRIGFTGNGLDSKHADVNKLHACVKQFKLEFLRTVFDVLKVISDVQFFQVM